MKFDSILLSKPQISVPGLKSALQASYLPLRPQACLQTSKLIFRPKIFLPDLTSLFHTSISLLRPDIFPGEYIRSKKWNEVLLCFVNYDMVLV